MTISVSLQNRNFTEMLNVPSSLILTPEMYATDVSGGPKRAQINVNGIENDVWRTIEWLRCPVVIEDNEIGLVWHGFINEVEITVGLWTIGVSLERMENRIKVVYNEPTVTGSSTKKETDWAQNDDSIATYGTKETRMTMSDVNTEAAEKKRDLYLSLLKYPQQVRRMAGGSNIQAVLRCAGWMETASWQYYAQPLGYIANVNSSSKYQKLGLGLTSQLGFNADKRTIHDLSARMSAFKKDDKIIISGSTLNSGTFTVEQGTSKEQKVVTTSGIAFRILTKKSRIKDSANGLDIFNVGENVTVTGSALNNGTYEIVGKGSDGSYLEFDDILDDETSGASITLAVGVKTYNALTISVTGGNSYQVTDLIGKNLDDLSAGDMISISGSAANNGNFFIESAASDGSYIEVDRAVTAAVAGPSVTITRGNAIKVIEPLQKSYGGESITLQIYGDAVTQRFQANGAWIVGELGVKARKVGTGHADNFRITLRADSAGVPGAVLQTINITGSALGTSADWVGAIVPFTTTLVDGSYYHLVLERTGALSTTAYYEYVVDESLTYTAGTMRLRVSGAYTGIRTPDADLVFRVIGYRETTNQIKDIILDACPFLAGVDIVTSSGVYTPQYRSGDLKADKEIDKLLSSGTSDGRRLLLTVTKDRVLRIDAEPIDDIKHRYVIDRNGDMRDFLDRPVPITEPIVGVWAEQDIVPAIVNTSRLAVVSPAFIEENEVNVTTGRRRLRFRGERNIFDVIEIKEG
jgi:hypothetical protein